MKRKIREGEYQHLQKHRRQPLRLPAGGSQRALILNTLSFTKRKLIAARTPSACNTLL